MSTVHFSSNNEKFSASHVSIASAQVQNSVATHHLTLLSVGMPRHLNAGSLRCRSEIIRVSSQRKASVATAQRSTFHVLLMAVATARHFNAGSLACHSDVSRGHRQRETSLATAQRSVIPRISNFNVPRTTDVRKNALPH